MKIRIIVEGGVIQGVISDTAPSDLDLEIIDRDDLAETASAADAAEIEREARADCPHELY